MNVLLLLDRVPAPDECARTSVDTDWLLDLAEVHDVVVAVDEASPALTPLRDAEITVHVSDKRPVHLPGGRLADADEALSGWLATEHAKRPFDFVVAAPERPQLGRVRSALPDIPWAVLAAAGPCALAHRLSVDTPWLDRHGHQLWVAASNVAAADVIASPVHPSALGLDAPNAHTVALLPVPEPDLREHAYGDLVVVAATGVSTVDAAWTVESALGVIDVHRSTTVVVLHAPLVADAQDVGPALAAGVPGHLQEQVVLVPTTRGGDAAAWLAGADALVLADTTELLIPAVARRAALVPTVLLGPDRRGAARTTELLTGPPLLPPGGDLRLVPWAGPTRVAGELRILSAVPDLEMVVLHREEAVAEASRWLELDGLDHYDVVLGGEPRGPWGQPRFDRFASGVVGLHRRTWRAVATELETGRQLHELIPALADLTGGRSHTIGLVALADDAHHTVGPSRRRHTMDLLGGPLRELRPPAAQDSAPSPAPRPDPADANNGSTPADALQRWVRRARWNERARLALPWGFGLADAIREGAFPDGVAQWAREHGISDRARLLLPWRWGLLPRAMEGHW